MAKMRMNRSHEACRQKTPPRLYKIGMFAGMSHVTIKTLRYYDEQNLLKPAFVDEENGYRYYEANQMAQLHRILALKNMGFSTIDIQAILNSVDEKSMLIQKKQDILREIAALTSKLAEVESYIANDAGDLSSPVLIKKLPEVIVCTLEKRIEAYDELFELMPQLGAEMERLDCKCAEPEYCFTNYLEPGKPEEDILVEACQAVVEKKEASDIVQFKIFPEIPEAACIFHKGSYDTFGKSYEALLKYIEENGYEICGNIRESYIDGVWNKDTPAEWLSEIQIPVRKIS